MGESEVLTPQEIDKRLKFKAALWPGFKRDLTYYEHSYYQPAYLPMQPVIAAFIYDLMKKTASVAEGTVAATTKADASVSSGRVVTLDGDYDYAACPPLVGELHPGMLCV
jgi:hypothetical protein